jgi:exoribonuclease-2
MAVDSSGRVHEESIYLASVENKAKLAYPSVGAWLAGQGPLPQAAAQVPELAEQLRTQSRVAQALEAARHEQGSLEFESREPMTIFENDQVVDLKLHAANPATKLIENFMIAANGVMARFLESHGLMVLHREVRTPRHWPEIVELAAEAGYPLPEAPDSLALQQFLLRSRKSDPETFADLSLTVIKLLGRGQYAVDEPGGTGRGHFGLAVRDYAHSTAPNRRYPDLITQRQVKAVFAGSKPPYSPGELRDLARHCSKQEEAVDKLERRMRKSAAAMLMANRRGQDFAAIVTGASEKGTWARLRDLPVEGKIVRKEHGLRVGQKLRVRLLDTDVVRGFIDFARL